MQGGKLNIEAEIQCDNLILFDWYLILHAYFAYLTKITDNKFLN